MENKRSSQYTMLNSTCSLPNPILFPFSRCYPTYENFSYSMFTSEFDDFKHDFKQAYYYQDGPKLRYLVGTLKLAASQLHLSALRGKCVELDLRLEQSYTIERSLIRQFLSDFDAAMQFCKKRDKNTTTPIN